MRIGVVTFPGTCDDADARLAVSKVAEPVALWHGDSDLQGVDGIVVPGGFSYGDYLRAGAIARFSPVMEAVTRFAEAGGPVIGICNGFQVLCESHLLPGVLMRNDSLQLRCEWGNLRREGGATPWATGIANGDVLRIPISHGEGNYFADAATLDALEANGQVDPIGGIQQKMAGARAAGATVFLTPAANCSDARSSSIAAATSGSVPARSRS